MACLRASWWDISLIDDWCGRATELTVGAVTPVLVNLGAVRKQAWAGVAGEMAQWLGTPAVLTEFNVQFPTLLAHRHPQK